MPKLKRFDFARLQKRLGMDDIPDRIMFYDIETKDRYAPYEKVNRIGVRYGFDGDPIVIRTASQDETFRQRYNDPDWWKVGFNNGNFDDIVLQLNGYKLNRTNWHDCYLMVKAIFALVPSYGLKFLNWWMFGDLHLPEGNVERFLRVLKEKDYSKIRPGILDPYLEHDIVQHTNIFRGAWEHVIEDPHWEAYM